MRCFSTTPEGRIRFAHSSPVHIDVPGKPLRPNKEEVQFLLDRIESEIERNENVLNEESLWEYVSAFEKFKAIMHRAQ